MQRPVCAGAFEDTGEAGGASVGGGVAIEFGEVERLGDAENVSLMGRISGSFWVQCEGLGRLEGGRTMTGSCVRGALLATGRRKGRPEAEEGSSCEVMNNHSSARGRVWDGEMGCRLGNGPVTFSPTPSGWKYLIGHRRH